MTINTSIISGNSGLVEKLIQELPEKLLNITNIISSSKNKSNFFNKYAWTNLDNNKFNSEDLNGILFIKTNQSDLVIIVNYDIELSELFLSKFSGKLIRLNLMTENLQSYLTPENFIKNTNVSIVIDTLKNKTFSLQHIEKIDFNIEKIGDIISKLYNNILTKFISILVNYTKVD